MLPPATEPVAVPGGRRLHLPLVPSLCGIVLGCSWVAACLTIVLPR